MMLTGASGVYRIKNTDNGVSYYGSASSIANRFSQHRRALAKGSHDNSYLQASWDKHGKGSFLFEPVLICRKEDLLFYEQLFLDKYAGDRKACFNIAMSATNTTLGHKWSDESRARLSEAKRRGGFSEAWKESARTNRRFKGKSAGHRGAIASAVIGQKRDGLFSAKVSSATKAAMGKGPSSIKKKAVRCSNGMVFDSAYQAAEWLKQNGWPKASKSGISGCCKGRHHSCYGLVWEYEKTEPEK